MKYDILIAGVGGQGTVLASRLIAAAAMEHGFFVRTAETIGMAQRGGCVTSHVRIGSEQSSSIIPFGAADLLIGFEPAEAVRSLPRLKQNGACVASTHAVIPVTASLSAAAYDVKAVLSALRARKNTVLLDAYAAAREAGSAKAANIVLLGAACRHGLLPFDYAALERIIAQNVPPKYRELNLAALAIGHARQ